MRLTTAAAAALLALAVLGPRAALADPSADAAKLVEVTATVSASAAKVGGEVLVRLAIKPTGQAHVDPRAPLKVALTVTPGLAIAKEKLGRADVVDAKEASPRFEIPVKAAAAGAQSVDAKVSFFLCTDAWCVPLAREFKLAVDVK